MEFLKMIIPYLWGPIVGAVIGYLTNLIAVKMMFHPYKPWKIGRFTVPFTPGIIPKRKTALAKAIGGAVSNYLFTGDDLRELALDETTKNRMVDLAMQALDIPLDFDGDTGELSTKTANELATDLFGEEQTVASKEKLADFVTARVMVAAKDINLGTIIAEQGAAVIMEKKSTLGVAALFLTENMVQAFLPQIAEKINEYIEENGEATVRSVVQNQIEHYADKPLHNILKYTGEAQIRTLVAATYEKLIRGVGSHFTEIFDINSKVEAKVAAMSPKELETLVLAIMKKELSAIINLGAIIGLVLGMFNIVL